MSKNDALRAMREARYLRNQQAARSTATTQEKPTKPTRPTTPAKQAKPAARTTEGTVEAADDGLCGHRNMSGRTCTRERGHAQKSHRYS